MSFVHIKKVQRPDKATGEMRDRFLVPAVAIETPQGKKLIPNPNGSEACVYDTLEEAEEAVRRAGFDFMFEGKKSYNFDSHSRAAAPRPVIQDDPLMVAIPVLIERLKDKEKAVMANAAFALGELGATQAIPALCESLGHEDGSVRKNVAEALAKLGHPAIQPLKQAWHEAMGSKNKDSPYVRLTIMTAFLELTHLHREYLHQILPVAVEGLEDENWLVRAQAALVVGHSAQILREDDD